MENAPVIKINGLRYKANKLSMGAYRQLVLLMEDMKNLTENEFKEDAVTVIRETFHLTAEQADMIDAADVIPVFGKISQWAISIFTSKVEQLPKQESPQAIPGQS